MLCSVDFWRRFHFYSLPLLKQFLRGKNHWCAWKRQPNSVIISVCLFKNSGILRFSAMCERVLCSKKRGRIVAMFSFTYKKAFGRRLAWPRRVMRRWKKETTAHGIHISPCLVDREGWNLRWKTTPAPSYWLAEATETTIKMHVNN